MKLKFKNQQYQTDAVNAICDLFLGQEKKQATFSVVQENQMNLLQNEFGIGNALLIDDKTIEHNMQEIQKRNKLPLTDLTEKQFSIEMETATGKTYVFTKTAYELNRRYGFTKFIVVVPSVAIREGVYKSFEITGEHFGNQYDNVPCRFFIYNSSKLSDVRQFATSNNIEIMVINIDAFKKSENIINQVQDRLGGETAMRYIQDTNPIVIVDEPQTTDSTAKSKDAIASLNPLCVLRYSATHREKINLMYRLTPVDAYNMGLVKQICVASISVANDFNKPYIKLLSVSMDKGFKAKVEIDIRSKDGTVSRKAVTVKQGDDLFLLSGERELYDGYQISGIDCTPGKEYMEFSNTEIVELNKAIGSVDENAIKGEQIRRTIEIHLDKELTLLEKGIKILTLFFIDEVKKYRTADGDKGIYAEMFEKYYSELLALPKYAELRNRFTSPVHEMHNGYFSQDKKGVFKDTKGDTQADDSTYNTIMRDKEWLLSFDCPLRFIWSHSALKEGWDNPNVFQICTLLDQKSVFTCRQKIGRGLRLPVNQDGERIEDKDITILHVVANESFSEFADNLQKEIETETGMKFGYLQIGMFTGMKYAEEHISEKKIDSSDAKLVFDYAKNNGFISEDGKPTEIAVAAVVENSAILPPQLEAVKESIAAAITQEKAVVAEDFIGKSYTEKITVEREFTYDESVELMEHFEKNDYISKSGKIKDTMKNALLTGTLDLPKKFEAARERLTSITIKADQKPPIRDASKEVVVRLKKQVVVSPEFKALWDKIKQKTTYRVEIDTEQLVKNCVRELKAMPQIPKARLVSQLADINIENAGVTSQVRASRTTDLASTYDILPHVINIISEEMLIKRATVRRILVESERAKDFLANPQSFLEKALDIIRTNRHSLAIDGIKYVKLDGEEYYALEIFDGTELAANLERNAIAVQKGVYDYVIYDSSTVERPFAVALDNDPDVKLFFKIPSRFKIETPIGTYNPDWAVFMEKDGKEQLYFVLETKGTTRFDGLRGTEQLKIHCGERHFAALENGMSLRVASNWDKFKIEN